MVITVLTKPRIKRNIANWVKIIRAVSEPNIPGLESAYKTSESPVKATKRERIIFLIKISFITVIV